jgi:hypothetical protein
MIFSAPHHLTGEEERTRGKSQENKHGKNKAQTSSFACTGKFLSKRKGEKIKNYFSV